ncbi:protein of unknown function [Candidatus Filomicrobium marinum]|uniref:Uncharacterized protein n=2 Tax=Filomicrobium TaxID=119044 RepID=A0A0D6JKH7_9HYPH|nr:protein of unknown function [Candidatus Filomicrobium marinum]CPR22441.1 protein of unknown function [Candidatus Filomicrobium marinum]SDO84452.1 hypothetical protein SAMN04488061_1802 [Filomicrobium insigne]
MFPCRQAAGKWLYFSIVRMLLGANNVFLILNVKITNLSSAARDLQISNFFASFLAHAL